MKLVTRKQQVEALMVRGIHHKEIAGQLDLSLKTVEKYGTEIYLKRGVRSQAELCAWHLQQPFPPPGMMYSKDGQRLELCEYTFDASGVPNAILVLADWDCDSPWQAPTWNVPLPELKLEYVALGSYSSAR